MKTPLKVSASILCANFSRLSEEIIRAEQAGVDLFHVDVMDGHFVPNITVGPLMVEAIRPLTKLPIDAHLMIENPGMYIEDFINAGADIISIHAECYGPLKVASQQDFRIPPRSVEKIDLALVQKDIAKIKKLGKKVFIVLNPGTLLCLDEVLHDIDGVLVMSVHPGFAKQKFMPEVLPKIRDLRSKFSKDIAIDGGINAQTAPEAVKAGANILATASYFFGAPDPKAAVLFLKSLTK